MENILLEIHEDVVSVIDKIKAVKDKDIRVDIPEGSVLFENSLNLRLIKKEAENLNKSIIFQTEDPEGLVILDIIDEGGTETASPFGAGEDFVSREVSISDVVGEKKSKKGSSGFFKSLSLPKFSFKLPEFSFDSLSFLPLLIALFVILGVGFGAYRVYWKVLKAEVNVSVESQPLVESIQIKVGTSLEDDLDKKTMQGRAFAASTTKTKTTKTTGTKTVGEKAEGEIEIINKTTSDKSFDSGERLYYESDDDMVYLLKESVTVSAAEPQDPSDPASVLVPGTKKVDVVAFDNGSSYNLESNKILEFEDYPVTDYVAKVSEDIDGGYLETISIVNQEDLDLLSQSLLTEITEGGEDRVKNLVEEGYIYIENSQSSSKTKEEFSHSVGDEADEVSVTQSVIFKGLAYEKDKLEDLLEPRLEESVPDGFELSSEDLEINSQPLGNTNETVLTTEEADLQVTVKSHVLPEIKEDEIKDKLVGVSIPRAREVLDEIQNIVTYSLNLSFKVPLINRMPNNPDNISIIIERE